MGWGESAGLRNVDEEVWVKKGRLEKEDVEIAQGVEGLRMSRRKG